MRTGQAKETGIHNVRGKSVAIRHATDTDLAFLEEILRKQGLDTDDLHAAQFVVAVEDDRIIGFGRLRKAGDAFDIACVIAAEERQNTGITEMIADHLIDYSGAKKAFVPRELADHFRKRGYAAARETSAGVKGDPCHTGQLGSVLMVYQK